jgi:cell division protein FtsB
MLLGVMLVVFASYVSPIRSYLEKTRMIEAEKIVTQDLKQKKEDLLHERDQLNNHGYVEQVARRDLGLVRPGEQPYVVKGLETDETAEPAPTSPGEERSLYESISDWLSSIIS